MQATHPNRRRIFYVDGNGVYLDRDGSPAAPYATLQEALAQCLPDSAYADFDDFQRTGPTIVLAPGEYSGAGLDRSVLIRGGAPCTINGLSGSCNVLLINDCDLPDLAIEVSGLCMLRNCFTISGEITGTVDARNCSFDGGVITGDLSAWNCLGASEITVSGTADIFGCNLAALTAGNGSVFNSYLLALTAEAENSGVTAYMSVVVTPTGPVTLRGCYPRPVFAPNLVGSTPEEAADLLAVAGLDVGVVTEAYDPVVAEGDIISQDPAAGALTREAVSVAYVVSLGVDPEA